MYVRNSITFHQKNQFRATLLLIRCQLEGFSTARKENCILRL